MGSMPITLQVCHRFYHLQMVKSATNLLQNENFCCSFLDLKFFLSSTFMANDAGPVCIKFISVLSKFSSRQTLFLGCKDMASWSTSLDKLYTAPLHKLHKHAWLQPVLQLVIECTVPQFSSQAQISYRAVFSILKTYKRVFQDYPEAYITRLVAILYFKVWVKIPFNSQKHCYVKLKLLQCMWRILFW